MNWKVNLQLKGRTLYLSVISITAILISVMSIYDSSLPSEAGRDQAPPQPIISAGERSCRSLFTITGVPDANTLATAQLLQYSGGRTTSNGSLGGDSWTPRRSHIGRVDQDVATAAAVRRVRHLLQQRSSPRGATTDDYRSLASLLPSLLSSHDASNRSGEHNLRKAPTLSVLTRIGTNGGVLPYVPCVITPFHDPAAVTACFRKKMIEKPLWISFMGDSKIRELYYEFLQRTDAEYRYTVELPNTTVSFRKLRKNYVKVHEDMEASTRVAPRLRITFCFRIFAETQPSKLEATKELQQLSRWASGEEASPQLLILGYTSWMMLRTRQHYPHDVLDYLTEMHRTVVPLLEQIGQRTRVLVLAQSRYRPHAVSGSRTLFGAAYSDAFSDWSEMAFQYYQRRFRQEGRRRPHTPPRGVAAWSEDREDQQSAPRPSIRGRQHARPIRDHLVPRETSAGGGGGLWWWDTSLPLNLAGISECEELYRRGLVTRPPYKGDLLCTDDHHADRVMLVDLVTMLLNLVCNSVLGVNSTHCCH